MRRGSLRPTGQRSRITRIAGGLASALFLFTVENIWIDPWLRTKSHSIPSLVPEPLGGTWFLAFAICGIVLVVLVVCEILVIRDRALQVSTKIGAGISVLVAMLLSAQWFRVTSGLPAIPRLQRSSKTHTVTLTWKASGSQINGYNIYRSITSGGNYAKINSSLAQGLTYTDDSVVSGVTYYYVARAVNDRGNECRFQRNFCESHSAEVTGTSPLGSRINIFAQSRNLTGESWRECRED